MPERVAIRAATNVTVDDETGCWTSNYSRTSDGYAQVGWADKNGRFVVLAHRASWVFFNGPVPVGMTLDHTCKSRACVNPEHLRILNNFENARRTRGEDFPLGECRRGHSNDLLVERKKRNKRGEPYVGLACIECERIHQRAKRARQAARRAA